MPALAPTSSVPDKRIEAHDLVPLETLQSRILLLRGLKVILDCDIAELYGVPTGVLNQAVKRNAGRFPPDFMFTLTRKEATAVALLRSQFVISNAGRGGRRYLPHAFTEQGVAMLSSVLNSERAITVNIAIMRVFVRLRQVLATHRELAQKFQELDGRVARNSADIAEVYRVMQRLLRPPRPARNKRAYGFRIED